jgi:hypothetical protein
MTSELKQNVYRTMFFNMSNKIVEYLDSKEECNKIVSEIKNMQQVFDLMDQKEQENIWNNLKKLMEQVPKEYFDNGFWVNLVFNDYKLEK